MLRVALVVLGFLGGLQSGAQSARPTCHSISFRHEILFEETFEKPIGGNLKFRLYPIRLGPKGELDGWRMEVVPEQAPTNDFIYPVNPPLRFNGVQIFGANHNEDAKASLGYPHLVRFLLRQEDFERLKTPLQNALWPYNAPDPDRAGPDYLDLLKTVPTGQLTVTVLSYETLLDKDSLRTMGFRAEITAPADFPLAPQLNPTPASCPAQP